MCGIFGFVNHDKPASADLLAKMSAATRHRGPDEQRFFNLGKVGLGANRLSIIDVAQGSQPLSNEDKTVWACQNGEIYNYRELKKKLKRQGHEFRTNSDTEVLVHLYEEMGTDFTKELRGMFALAIWDKKLGKLVLARDRLGIKPLYYAPSPRNFYFASELQAIYQAGGNHDMSRQAVGDFLALNYIPRRQTIFTDMYKLLPGELLELKTDRAELKFECRLFWDVPVVTGKQIITNKQTAVNGLQRHLRSAVKSHLVSDVPVGAFLSGGLDSSTVVALASRQVKKLKTFSVGFKEKSFDELHYARAVARRCQTDHHEIEVDLSRPEYIEKIVRGFDEPFADSSALAVYAVSEFAAGSVKTVLSGDGGDEMFGGYTIYHADRMLKLYRHFPKVFKAKIFPGLAKLIPASHKKTTLEFKLKRFLRGGAADPVTAHFLWRAIFTESQKAELMVPGREGIKPTARFWHQLFNEHQGDDFLNNLMYLDTKINLVDDMLTKVDRTSMMNSLEVRVPLLDHKLAEYAAQISSTLKVRHNSLKYILKEAVKNILPPEVLNRPKAGFQVPVAYWLKNELRDLAAEYFSHQKITSQDFFDPATVSKMYADHCSGRADYNRELWGILSFGIWYDNWNT